MITKATRTIFLAAVLAVTACSAKPDLAGVEKAGPDKTTLHLAHDVTITIPDQLSYNARLAGGSVTTKLPTPAKVDPLLPQLAELQDFNRAAPGIGEEQSDQSILLESKYEDGEYEADIDIEIVWWGLKKNLSEMNALIGDEGQLHDFAQKQEQDIRSERNIVAFMDSIGISGWKITGYPVIDYQYHSKRGEMQNFDRDYIYNRRLLIFREDGTIFVSISMPVSRQKSWGDRIEQAVRSLVVERSQLPQ